MKHIIMFLASVLLIAFSGCKELTHDGYGTKRRSFVEYYVEPQNIRFSTSINIDSVVVVKGTFRVSGEFFSKGAKYDALCKKNSDMKYNRGFLGPPIIALTQSLQSITLIALDDFNESYTTGSDISEVVDITFTSAASYIKNGYNKTPVLPENKLEESNPLNYATGYQGLMTYKMRMNEINATNSYLCGNEFYMKFTQEPKVKGPHRFNLIMRFDERTLEQEFAIYFE